MPPSLLVAVTENVAVAPDSFETLVGCAVITGVTAAAAVVTEAAFALSADDE